MIGNLTLFSVQINLFQDSADFNKLNPLNGHAHIILVSSVAFLFRIDRCHIKLGTPFVKIGTPWSLI